MSSVVLLHGFTQTGRSWEAIERELGADHAVRCPELPPRPPWEVADLLAAGDRACYVGYSMGGRLALHVALAHPDAVGALVLVSSTAGIDGDGERDTRRAADEQLATRLEAIGATAFLDEWLAQPMFAGLSPEAQGRAARSNDAAALAAALRVAGAGAQESLWGRLGELTMPVLVIVGEHDTTFRAIGERLTGALAGGELAVVPDAGHAVPFEQPEAFLAVLRPWLAAVDPT